MSQKWFWGFLALIFLLVATINFLAFLLTMKTPSLSVSRSEWGAEESVREMKLLTLPVTRIVITQTGDKESCDNPVRILFKSFLIDKFLLSKAFS